MKLKVEAIGKNPFDKSVKFILSDYNEVSLSQLMDYIKKEIINDLIIVKGRFGKYIRSLANRSTKDNLSCGILVCNKKDYLLFTGRQLILKSINGRTKKIWTANAGMPGSTPQDQHKKDFGPLPAGEYTVNFDQTLDYEEKENLWDKVKWIVKSPTWGLVVTPLTPHPKNIMYGRDGFTIHGGLFKGTKGCIELQEHNREFHIFARLYMRNFRLVVRYDKTVISKKNKKIR